MRLALATRSCQAVPRSRNLSNLSLAPLCTCTVPARLAPFLCLCYGCLLPVLFPSPPLLSPRPPCPPPCPAGKKRWVGANEWQGLPAVKVALGVRGSEVVEWVLDRMTR